MAWRDFFYFSKGERSALIVLLCLITVAGILLIINNNNKQSVDNREIVVAKPDTVTITETPEIKKVNVNNPKSEKKENRKPVEKKENKEKKDESVAERSERIITTSRNASRPTSYPRAEKFEAGTVVELNTSDTTILKKVPGIGSAYAARIIKFRDLLGGFYSVNQLAEIYGMDEERFNALKPWFTVDVSLIKKLNLNESTFEELNKHPYIDYKQAKVISQLRKQKGKLTGWENLQLLDEFTDLDKIRALPYFSFE